MTTTAHNTTISIPTNTEPGSDVTLNDTIIMAESAYLREGEVILRTWNAAGNQIVADTRLDYEAAELLAYNLLEAARSARSRITR